MTSASVETAFLDEPASLLPEEPDFHEASPDATQLYLKEIGYSPLLTPAEEMHFGQLAKSGDPDGRKRMIESNLRLVVKIARRNYSPPTDE